MTSSKDTLKTFAAFKIIRAEPGMAARLSDLCYRSKAYWDYSDAFMQACKAELTLSPLYIEQNPTYVLHVGDKTAGFYALEHLNRSEVELGYLFVEPVWIAKGVGRKLFEHALIKSKDMHYSRMIIQSDPHSVAFYEKFDVVFDASRRSDSLPDRKLPLGRLELTDKARA